MFEWILEYLPEENILLLKSKGIMDVPSANSMVKAVADGAVEHQCFKHLIDHRETRFDFRLTDYYKRPAINEQLGISRKFKIAMVFAQITKDTKFMETVFNNRGYNLRHFTNIEEARQWLWEE